MNELRNTLLIFFWGIPFFFLLGRLSFFYSDEFLGNWILMPKEYSLSYSIFFGVVFFCSTIFNFILGNIKNSSKLISILLGIFFGSIINLCFLIFGFLKFVYYFNWIFALFFIIILENIWKLTGIIPPTGWEKNILIICWAMALLFLFNLLAKKLDDLKEKIWLAILIVSLPFFPMIIAPGVGSFIGDRLSSESRKKSSPVKRAFLGIPLLTLIIFGFIWMIKYYHLPSLIISPNIRASFGNTHYLYLNAEQRNKSAFRKLSNCQLIKNEIGEIENIVLFEGKNTHGGFFGFERSFLHIQIIGENKQAFVKACFQDGGSGPCSKIGVKISEQNQAKIFSDTGVKTLDISECL